MAQDWAVRFYKSKQWQKCRDSYFNYRNGLCERCLKEGRISPGEIVHHKAYITPSNIGDPNITLNFQNLELLCQDCHNKEHSKQVPISDEIEFDGAGNVVKRN